VQKGRLCLRLALATHGAIGHHSAILEMRQRWVQRMERLSARLQRVPAIFRQPEGGARFCQVMPVLGKTSPDPNSK
jgi:hypothetical protein